ncbi:MAG: squalene synthase HpnC [Pseudomonadota bacterium]
MAVDHYENFPVASVLLPRRLRAPVAAIYRFARAADDCADEGDLPPQQRLALLDGFRAGLDDIAAGRSPKEELFKQLSANIGAHGLPLEPFYHLLDAFRQDVVKQRYASFAEVMDYCRRSADPVGRLLLHLYHATDEENFKRADAICSALQLINFWQDVAVDYAKNRIYLPQDDMVRFGVDEAQIARGDAGGNWWPLMAFQIERTRTLMNSGAPLGRTLKGRIGLELRMIVAGGNRILDKIEQCRGDVFNRRPVLRTPDWGRMLWRAAVAS